MVRSLKWDASTTSVSPSQRPAERPNHWRMCSRHRLAAVQEHVAVLPALVPRLVVERNQAGALHDAAVAARDARAAVLQRQRDPFAAVVLLVLGMVRPVPDAIEFGDLGLPARAALGRERYLAVRRIDDQRRAAGVEHRPAAPAVGVVVGALHVGDRARLGAPVAARPGGAALQRRHLVVGQELPALVLVRPLQRRQDVAGAPDALQVRVAPRRARRGVIRLGRRAGGHARQQTDCDEHSRRHKLLLDVPAPRHAAGSNYSTGNASAISSGMSPPTVSAMYCRPPCM